MLTDYNIFIVVLIQFNIINSYKKILLSLIQFLFQGPDKNSEFDNKIRRLLDMGIDEHKARVALSSYDWDLERATEQLFS